MDYGGYVPVSVPRILMAFSCEKAATSLNAHVQSNVHICTPGINPPRDGLSYDIVFMMGSFTERRELRKFFHEHVKPRTRDDTVWYWL